MASAYAATRSTQNFAPSPTSIIEYPISETRLRDLHHFLTETGKRTISLAETLTFIGVMREEVLATSLRIQGFCSGHHLGDNEGSGPTFRERICVAFPGNERITTMFSYNDTKAMIMSWRTAEKVALGESFGEEDAGEVNLNRAADGSITGPQFPHQLS